MYKPRPLKDIIYEYIYNIWSSKYRYIIYYTLRQIYKL